jgi:hypothetical protein
VAAVRANPRLSYARNEMMLIICEATMAKELVVLYGRYSGWQMMLALMFAGSVLWSIEPPAWAWEFSSRSIYVMLVTGAMTLAFIFLTRQERRTAVGAIKGAAMIGITILACNFLSFAHYCWRADVLAHRDAMAVHLFGAELLWSLLVAGVCYVVNVCVALFRTRNCG